MNQLVGHHQRPRRIRVSALIESLDLAAPLLVFGERVLDSYRRADPRQREEAGRGFTMQPNAAVGVRRRDGQSLRGIHTRA